MPFARHGTSQKSEGNPRLLPRTETATCATVPGVITHEILSRRRRGLGGKNGELRNRRRWCCRAVNAVHDVVPVQRFRWDVHLSGEARQARERTSADSPFLQGGQKSQGAKESPTRQPAKELGVLEVRPQNSYPGEFFNPSKTVNRGFCPPPTPRSASASGRDYGIHKLVLCVHYNGVFIPYIRGGHTN